jgi:acetyl esterase/lipase
MARSLAVNNRLPDYPPEVTAVRIERLASGAPPLYEMSVEEARAADLAAIRAETEPPGPVAQLQSLEFEAPAGRLPARLYAPGGRRPPVLVYFFGGGWVLGQIDTADAIARSMTTTADIAVFVPGYRLAPEHKFPAAVEDAEAAVRWIARNATRLGVDGGRIAVGGDSAGGNLAAAVTHLLRDAGGPQLAFQLLVYPVTEYLADTASARDVDDPVFFNPRSVRWYWEHYLPSPKHGRDPRASPLLAERFEDLPPGLVITAEHDPLRDEGEQYAEKLASAGVPVRLSRYEGMVHGFFAMTRQLAGARAAHAEAAAALRAALSTRPPCH